MLLLGENPKIVQERLGDAHVEMTLEIYSHLLPGMQRAAADRLDALLQSVPPPDPNGAGGSKSGRSEAQAEQLRELGGLQAVKDSTPVSGRNIVPFRKRAQ